MKTARDNEGYDPYDDEYEQDREDNAIGERYVTEQEAPAEEQEPVLRAAKEARITGIWLFEALKRNGAL